MMLKSKRQGDRPECIAVTKTSIISIICEWKLLTLVVSIQSSERV